MTSENEEEAPDTEGSTAGELLQGETDAEPTKEGNRVTDTTLPQGCQPHHIYDVATLEKQAEELPSCSHPNTEAWRRNKGLWRCGICHPSAVPEGVEWYKDSDDPAVM